MSIKPALAANFLLVAVLSIAAPQFARAATQCACFFNQNGTPSCDLQSGEGIENQADCTERCQLLATGGKAVTQSTFFENETDPDAVTSASQCTAQQAGNPPPPQPDLPSPIKFTKPVLSIDIPGVSFSEPLRKGDKLNIPFLGEYLSGVYKYLLGISLTIAIVMVMVGGVQYVVAGGSGEVAQAKQRITNAVTGLLLLFGVYVILYTVNPQLTIMRGIELDFVDPVVQRGTSGAEGTVATAPSRNCQEAVAKAHQDGTCPMTEGKGSFGSPTGSPFSCNYHFKDDNYDYTKIKNLDFAAGWGTAVQAPFDGTISYTFRKTANDRCGNTIVLDGSGTRVVLCHIRDFLDDQDQARTGDRLQVKKGDIIGHVGGRCCEGEVAPDSDWSQGDKCTFSTATICTDPFDPKAKNCTCQPISQSGNTSGPHVHITWKGTGNILACVPN